MTALTEEWMMTLSDIAGGFLSGGLKTACVCDRCATPGEVHHGQSRASGRLAYWSAFRCTACGNAFEADGPAPPREIRELMLARDGLWALTIVADADARASTIRALSHHLGVSLRAALELVRQTPNEIATGTRVEMEYLADVLGKTGATIFLRKS